MASLTLTLSGNYAGLPEGSGTLFFPPLVVSSAVYERIIYSLSSGNNTIPVPTGATLVIFIPPAGNTVQVFLKGLNADTGIPISRIAPWFYPIDLTAPPANVVLNAASSISNFTVIFF